MGFKGDFFGRIQGRLAVIDSLEILKGVWNEAPSFSKLSQRSHIQDSLRIVLLSKAMPAVYVVFDILYQGTGEAEGDG